MNTEPTDIITTISWVFNGPVFRLLLPVLFLGGIFQIAPKAIFLRLPQPGEIDDAILGEARTLIVCVKLLALIIFLTGVLSTLCYFFYISHVGPEGIAIDLKTGKASASLPEKEKKIFIWTLIFLFVESLAIILFYYFLQRVREIQQQYKQ